MERESTLTGIEKVCEISMRSHFNHTFLVRFTKGFAVWTAPTPTGHWTLQLNKTLAEQTNMRMGWTMETVFARYVRFSCMDYYKLGCALQYFKIY